MSQESAFLNTHNREYRKERGQFFTPETLASLMREWISGSERILDPACGTGILLRGLSGFCTGYDIDKDCLSYLEGGVKGIHQDFMVSPIEQSYDGIIANPPYIRHNHISNMSSYLSLLKDLTGIQFSGNINLYALIMIKSLFHLQDNGKAVFLIPVEWSNANFGSKIKEWLLSTGYVRHVVFFECDVFNDNMSSGCLVFMEKSGTDILPVFHYTNFIPDTLSETFESDKIIHTSINDTMFLSPKWSHLNHNVPHHTLSQVLTCRRGITTGNNKYFMLTDKEREIYDIPHSYLTPCLSKATYARNTVFSLEDWNTLRDNNKPCWLLDIHEVTEHPYIQKGINDKVNEGYITSHRNTWYFMENMEPPDILCNVFYRDKPRFIRNDAGVKTLTCFHGLYVKDGFDIDDILTYLNSPESDLTIRNNQRHYGKGLFKMEPKDILSLEYIRHH